MKDNGKVILSFPEQKMGEAERKHRRNLDNLVEIVQDIDRAGKMIGRPTLLLDFLYHLLFVIGSMNQQDMISVLGVISRQTTKTEREVQTACKI